MRKLVLVFCSVILVLSFLPIENVMGSNPNPDGAITFEPNVIPELNITFVEEFFRFKWKQNRFDLKLLIHCDGKNLSLRDFWEKTDRVMNWENMSRKATESMYEFGYMIEDIPQVIADDVEFLVWKIEGASFDLGEIEIEEKDSFLDLGYNITRFHLPDNLVLSYEDLWLYDFKVSHPNKHETVVKGVKGKTSWNLDPIVFSGGVITITDYDTEGSACDHEEIYTQLSNASQFAKLGPNQYFSNGLIVIGNGTGSTWFVDSDVQVSFNSSCFTANYQIAYEVKTNSHLRFGVLTDETEKLGKHGVDVYVEAIGYLLGISMVYGNTGEVLVYSSHFRYYNPTWDNYGGRLWFKGNSRVWDCLLDQTVIWIMAGSTVDIFEVVFTTKSGINIYGGTPTISRVSLYDSGTNTAGRGLCFYLAYSGNIENLYMRKTGVLNPIYAQGITVDHNLINADFDKWSIQWIGTSTAEIYRQYTFDLTVTYPNGTGIENANVTVKHYGQSETQDFTELTDSNGQIATKTLSKGFYNQTGGDTMYSYEPFNLQINNITDYQTYNGNFTLPEKKGWIIALKAMVNTGPTARFTFSPSDPQTNTAVNFNATDSTDSDGAISSYAWNYGDGNSDTGQTSTHTYASAGGYEAMLTVTDDDGATDSFNQTITVSVPQSQVSPAPVIRKTSVKTTFKGPLTYYPSVIELLQKQATITATVQLDNTICTSNITLFYTVTSDETKDVVETGNKTFWIRPDGSETVELTFTAPFTWGKADTTYTLSTYTMFSITKSDITVYPIIIRQGATVNLVRNGLIVAVLGFLGGLAYYMYRSKPKKERNVLKLPDGSEIRL